VIARADVSRAIFYKYFNSVDEAIEQRASELVDEMIDGLKDLVLILATWAREHEDALAAPCAYKHTLRKAPGKGFGPLLLQEAAREAQRASDWRAYGTLTAKGQPSRERNATQD